MTSKHIAQILRPHRLRAAGGLLAATLGMMSVLPAVAAGPTASSAAVIAVEGNRRVDAETIRSYFHSGTDGQFDEAARDAALKSLLATKLFDKVSIDRTARGLIVHVTEAPVLDRVAFEGNKKVKDADLAAAVESKPRGTLQRAAIQSDVNRIVEAYRHVGRDEVSVVPEVIDRGNGRADLVYMITEGAKTTVRRINFTGNQAFGARQLNAVIKTSERSVISMLTGGDVYDPDRIAQDRERLRLYYRSKGYADANVRAGPTTEAPSVGHLGGGQLVKVLVEGPGQDVLGSATWYEIDGGRYAGGWVHSSLVKRLDQQPRSNTTEPEGGSATGRWIVVDRRQHSLTLVDHGEWLIGQGRAEEAALLLEEARGIFERLDARPWLQRLEEVAPGGVTVSRGAGGEAVSI